MSVKAPSASLNFFTAMLKVIISFSFVTKVVIVPLDSKAAKLLFKTVSFTEESPPPPAI